MFEFLAHVMWMLMMIPLVASVVVGLCAIVVGLVLTRPRG